MTKFLRSAPTVIKQIRSQLQRLLRWHESRQPIPRIAWAAGGSIIVSATGLTGCFWGIQQVGGLQTLELLIFDRLVQRQPDAGTDPRLLIVTITEPDINRYRWPLSDQIVAQTLQQLQTYQPKVIGLDLYRDIHNPPGTAALDAQLRAKNLIAITENASAIAAPSVVEAERVGFNDLTFDADGVLRRNLMFVAGKDQDYYSFALRLVLAYFKDDHLSLRYTPQTLQVGTATIVAIDPTSGGYQTADTRGYQVLLNYRRRQVAQTISLSQVLDGQVNPAWVRDKIVLIGTTAPSLKDRFYTPYSADQQNSFQMPGVVLHAQMTSQLLDMTTGQNSGFQFWSQGSEQLWLWTWTLIGGFLVWKLRHPLAFGLATLVCLFIIIGISWALFMYSIWIPIAEPILGLIAAVGLAMAHRLLYTTTRDPLTGLLNQSSVGRYLRRSLDHLSRYQPPVTLGVLFLSLDRFPLIAKSLGQTSSDRLLLQLISRWQRTLPRSARLARVSQDEFVIALRDPQKDAFTALAEQLQTALAQPFLIHQRSVAITASIGIALTQADHWHTAENLLRDAHTAMYRAKTLGTDHYQVFATGMLTEAVDQFTLENELRRGIVAQEFVLYYQPIVCLKSGIIVGFEALVRWQHPSQGFIPPLKFIPLAEETGLIIPLGQWIFQAACQQAHQWQRQFPEQNLMISINLSGRQFDQPGLIDQLARIIQETQICEARLKLEITESMVMGDVEAAIDIMLRLKALGCKLGMDDFGTGYSSLSQIRRLPIDTLKVDRSFVQKLGASQEDYEIARMIISLGHTLGMDVIAEGVETQTDAETLRSMGCEFGQGYFWAKPLPATEATERLRQQNQLITCNLSTSLLED
ncbi:EAL domain-containing protein [Pantanalinema sp. GBBB05]|uniref:EAL domain-containing protein n=1 Tax=Pantanalinema sp. GBBB05 TaxID=2604139 RepID=UPI001DCE7C3D|nr:EAL domain-containing protein [Pantanalinema sp. GBBB05]